MEPLNFTAANEDGSCYSFDSRKLDEATCVHKDHVSAVMDIDFSPTGREFVTGSYDRSVRIFPYKGGHSREIYHTKRMQRVFCVKYSCDATYIISGSDDTNLRLWKAKASEQLGVILPREQKKHEYNEAVKKRYQHLPDVKRIVRHRHLPKAIHIAKGLQRTMTNSKRKKEERIKAHSTPGTIVKKPLRQRRIIKEVDKYEDYAQEKPPILFQYRRGLRAKKGAKKLETNGLAQEKDPEGNQGKTRHLDEAA